MKRERQTVQIAIAVAGWLIAGFLGYAHATTTTDVRISVLENQIGDIKADLAEVKDDVKTLIRR